MSDDNEDEICTSDENDASSDDSSDSSSDDDSDGDGDDECDGGDELKGTGDIYAKLCDSSVPAAKVNVYHFGNETEYIKASSSYSSQPKFKGHYSPFHPLLPPHHPVSHFLHSHRFF